MKHNQSIQKRRWSGRFYNKGIALVVVLSCLLLVCGLVLSFFLSISTETRASKFSDSSSRSRDLTDTAVNLVMAQIREATSQGGQTAWASQPGMIRTYGSTTGAGSSTPLAYYKLYSADQMVVSPSGSSGFNPLIDVPGNWHATPALYTDLNQPAKDLGGVLQYPIVDPSAATAGAGIPAVKGFTFVDAPVADSGPVINSLPMPVRWVYVLQDGKLTVPSGGTESTATWSEGAANAPTADNPIVGRVAFWTDDETSKVNINTAVGDEWVENPTGNIAPGSYWSLPYFDTPFEKTRLASYQPAQYEYQRYPGHPATTYLSAVFPSISRDGLSQIVPRVQAGGSLGGSIIATSPLTLDADRLYASIDELIFDAERSSQGGILGVNGQELNRSRFFLTASSKAPETNLFNRPRVSIWPLHQTDSAIYRTAFDRLIAFCSKVNGRDYSFTRANAYSPTDDWLLIQRNRTLYEYLSTLTSAPVPGFGGAFQTKYGEDRTQILTEIFDYIRSTNLFDDSLEIAAQGGNTNPASWSYPTRGSQFTMPRTSLVEAANGHGYVVPIKIASNDTMGFGRFETLSEVGLHFICSADGSGDPTLPPGDPVMIPATDDNERLLLNDAKLASNNVAPVEASTVPFERPAYGKNKTLDTKLDPGQIRIEALFLTELFSVAHGWTAINRDIQIRVEGLDQLSLQGGADGSPQNLGFPADATMLIQKMPRTFAHSRVFGGSGGFRVTMMGGTSPKGSPLRGSLPKDGASSTILNTYPFISRPVTITPGAGNSMRLTSDGLVTVKIYAGLLSASAPAYPGSYVPDEGKLVQTIELDFLNGASSVSFPAPSLIYNGHNEVLNGNVELITYRENFWSFSRDGAIQAAGAPYNVPARNGRLNYISRPPNRGVNQSSGGLFREGDVVRTLVPRHGDYRLVAGRSFVPASVFAPHQFYNDMTQQLAHSFTEGYNSHGNMYKSTKNGKLTKMTQAYNSNRWPDVPYRADTEGGAWGSDSGDWDNGIAYSVDGAYINKPDEGHTNRGASGNDTPYFGNDWQVETSGPTFFSPNRQVMSPGMFGSLPTQIKADQPWRTLLFRPDTSTISGGHIGAASPKDHLLMDLFWMPVVEPYAISEPFATAGKINMNFQMVPFTYIERATGLQSLFKSEKVTAVPVADAGSYKSGSSKNYRYDIDIEPTLDQFRDRFENNDIFRSATEICDIHLIPKTGGNLNAASMNSFWATTNALTGDNVRERPYATLYPRLTTKSNTYTVHFQVQVLQQASRSRGTSPTAWATWDNSRDLVQSEIRGSTTIERYVDPSDPNLPDFAELPAESSETLDSHYRFRVLNTRRFAP